MGFPATPPGLVEVGDCDPKHDMERQKIWISTSVKYGCHYFTPHPGARTPAIGEDPYNRIWKVKRPTNEQLPKKEYRPPYLIERHDFFFVGQLFARAGRPS